MKSRGYAVPYVGGHHTWKETAPSLGYKCARDLRHSGLHCPFSISTGLKPQPRTSMSHSGREANGRCDTYCSTLQELYGRTFRVDKLVGIQTGTSLWWFLIPHGKHLL